METEPSMQSSSSLKWQLAIPFLRSICALTLEEAWRINAKKKMRSVCLFDILAFALGMEIIRMHYSEMWIDSQIWRSKRRWDGNLESMQNQSSDSGSHSREWKFPILSGDEFFEIRLVVFQPITSNDNNNVPWLFLLFGFSMSARVTLELKVQEALNWPTHSFELQIKVCVCLCVCVCREMKGQSQWKRKVLHENKHLIQMGIKWQRVKVGCHDSGNRCCCCCYSYYCFVS